MEIIVGDIAMDEATTDRLTGMFMGLAVGDALGMPVEFKARGTFPEVHDFEGGGAFHLPAGYWTDDTSMALCLADSILACQGYDSYDVMERYAKWRDEGYRSSTGECFDIGNQTTAAITKFKEHPGVATNEPRTEAAGNGSIMRLAPVVIASIAAGNTLATTMRLGRVSARETHFSLVAEQATHMFAGVLYNAVNAQTKDEVLQFDTYHTAVSEPILELLQSAQHTLIDDMNPSGYVLDTLKVAVWAFMTTDTFRDGALKVVNMGGDADTIAAVYGQLAGAYYGIGGIPHEWVDGLYQHNEITKLATQLAEIKKFGIKKTRFREDRFGGPGDPVRAVGFPDIDART